MHIKKVIIILCIAAVALLYWPAKQDSALYRTQYQIIKTYHSEKYPWIDYETEIKNKKEKLYVLEEALSNIDSQIVNLKANAPTCPISGRPKELTITDDPRPKLRQDIHNLRNDIEIFEGKKKIW